MHVVTISATYGAAGSVVGPAVAERLGVPFFDRAIPTAVADDLRVGLDHAMSRDERAPGWMSRLLAAAAPMSAEWMVNPPLQDAIPTDERFLSCTQNAIRRCIGGTGGVILGRAGAIVLRGHPTALHVRLDGDPERRVRQAMRILGVSEEHAREAQAGNDRARNAYVRHFYREDATCPEHYDLVVDSTRIPLPTCIDLIASAAASDR